MWGQNFFSNERCASMSSKENDADEKTGDANKRKATIFKGKVFEGVKGDGIHTRGRGHWPQEQGHGIHATRKDRGAHDTAAREVRCQREHRFSSHCFLLHMGKNDVYLRERAI